MPQTPHYGQIITTRKNILNYINDINKPVTYNTIDLITSPSYTQDYYLRLYDTCSRLYTLSKLVYHGKNGIQKLPVEQYHKLLFSDYAETADEITHIANLHGKDNFLNNRITIAELTMKLEKIEILWCRSISRLWEQVYIPELAYEFEYIIIHAGILPLPVFSNEYSLFPSNYPDFNYSEGIANYYEEIMISIF